MTGPGSVALRESLEGLTRIRGVVGAMLVSADDGLVVAETLMEGIPGEAVAALAASLTRRITDSTAAAGFTAPAFLHLQAATGAVLVAPSSGELLLVAVGDRELNPGLTRIQMLQVAESVG